MHAYLHESFTVGHEVSRQDWALNKGHHAWAALPNLKRNWGEIQVTMSCCHKLFTGYATSTRSPIFMIHESLACACYIRNKYQKKEVIRTTKSWLNSQQNAYIFTHFLIMINWQEWGFRFKGLGPSSNLDSWVPPTTKWEPSRPLMSSF